MEKYKKMSQILCMYIVHLQAFCKGAIVFTKRSIRLYIVHMVGLLYASIQYEKALYAGIEKLLSVKTDKIINISFNEYQESISRGFSKGKSRLIYNGVSAEFRKSSIDYRLDSSKINLLFVGRFDHQKGLDILLDFFPITKMRR